MPKGLTIMALLEPQIIRRLEQLELQTRRILSGQMKGERRSPKKGAGLDFADYRHYARGDDLRHIDWNIYGRLDRLFIKIFHEEQDLQCHLLLDTSKSMRYGEPDKFNCARALAAAIAYVGLTGQEKVGLTCFQATPSGGYGPVRGRHHLARLFKVLENIEPDGQTSLEAICRSFSQRVRGRGMVILISDLLDPAGFEGALRFLVRGNLDVTVLHVLAPQEIDPTLAGHLDLHDLETGHRVEVTVNEAIQKAYRRNVEAFCTKAREYCTKYGMLYQLVRSDTPIEELIVKRLRESGLLK